MHVLEEKDYLDEIVISTTSPKFRRNGSFVRVPSPVSPNLRRSGSYVCLPSSSSVDSFSRYDKLPQGPMTLTVLKLDGSSFDIKVAKEGKVADLRQAVEDAFKHFPKRVSWSHVWGNFCLYYGGQKLLCDKDDIAFYGIKDGDQLQFIRHVSINYNKRTLSESDLTNLDGPISSKVYEGIESYLQEGDIEKGKISGEYYLEGIIESSSKGSDNESDNMSDEGGLEDYGIDLSCNNRLANSFRRWFSYHKLSNGTDSQMERKNKLSNGFAASFRNLARFSSQGETWKAE